MTTEMNRLAQHAAPIRKGIRQRARLAYHEAGHAVLSAAINDSPDVVSIEANDWSLGRNLYRTQGRPERLVQVHLAGFAAEELLSGSRSRQFAGSELGLSILIATEPSLASLEADIGRRDQYLAVQEVLKMGCARESEAIQAEIERFYCITKESLSAVWPAVVSVANALLKHSQLDMDAFFTAIKGHDIYVPVFAVQDAHGLGFKADDCGAEACLRPSPPMFGTPGG